jgi:predicted enzyme related to lactoylglutathione lyase
MEGKVVTISLVVKDKAKALTFFTEKAGFEKKTDVTGPGGYRYVTVGFKDQDFEIALWEMGSATDPSQQEWSKGWTPGSGPPIVIQVPDCRGAYQELSSRGVTFPQPPMDQPWGIVATFRDPDGNVFSLSQPKGRWTKE